MIFFSNDPVVCQESVNCTVNGCFTHNEWKLCSVFGIWFIHANAITLS